MPQLLFVDACVRGAESRSRMLAERFLSSYAAANPDTAILHRDLMRDRLEPQYPEVLACRDALAAAGRAHEADVDARQRKKKTARHHRVVTCAQGDRVALAALLHGDKERGRAHAALHVAVRRAHDEGFTVLPVHGVASGNAKNERNSTGLNEESISQFAFLDKSRHMD